MATLVSNKKQTTSSTPKKVAKVIIMILLLLLVLPLAIKGVKKLVLIVKSKLSKKKSEVLGVSQIIPQSA